MAARALRGRLCCVMSHGGRSALPNGLSSEEHAVELTRLGARQARLRKQFDHLVCKISLLSWKRRRVAVVPAQPSTNVCVEPHLLARDLVGNPVELLHLLEQGLELIVVNGHVGSDASVLDEPFARIRRSRVSQELAPITSTPARIVRCTSLRASPPCGTRATRIQGRRRPPRRVRRGRRGPVRGAQSSLPRPRSRTCIPRTASRWRGSLQARIGRDAARAPRGHGGGSGARGGRAGRGRIPAQNLPPAASAGRSQISTEYAT